MMKRTAIILFTLVLSLSLNVHAKKKTAEDEGMPLDLTNIKTAVENHGNSLANLTNQVNEILSQFQMVRGDTGRNYSKNKEQDKVLTDSQARLQVLEDQVNILTGQLAELQKEGLMTKTASQVFDEYKEYAKGLQYVNSRDYDKAITEFKKFQESYKKSIYTNYAQFWIGESYYMQADYPMAIKQYQELLSKNAKSAKAPMALYRQGMSFFQLQSLDDAEAFFTKVIRSYPATVEAVQASAQIKRINTIQELQKQQELELKMVE